MALNVAMGSSSGSSVRIIDVLKRYYYETIKTLLIWKSDWNNDHCLCNQGLMLRQTSRMCFVMKWNGIFLP